LEADVNKSPGTRRSAAAPVALLLGLGSILAGCGGDDSSPDPTTTTAAAAESSATQVAATGEITVDGAWARTSPSMATAGAVYLEITNGTDTDDALVGVSVDPSVAATAELHETAMAEDDEDQDGPTGGEAMSQDGTDGHAGSGGGMMTMKPVEEIPVPAGATVVLGPGGYHVMLIDLAEPLAAGGSIEITLELAVAGEMVVEAEVRDTAP
jgi:copper(I)-binding protein